MRARDSKNPKVTGAAVAVLWVLRHDYHQGGLPFRSARDLVSDLNGVSESGVRYGITSLERHKLAVHTGYDATRKNVMVWAFNPEAEVLAKAIIDAHHEELVEKATLYRDVYDRDTEPPVS